MKLEVRGLKLEVRIPKFQFSLLTSGFSLSSGSLAGSPATRYDPSAQRARSCSLQRSLQNGRQAGSPGWRRQNTHTGSDIAGLFYANWSRSSLDWMHRAIAIVPNKQGSATRSEPAIRMGDRHQPVLPSAAW